MGQAACACVHRSDDCIYRQSESGQQEEPHVGDLVKVRSARPDSVQASYLGRSATVAKVENHRYQLSGIETQSGEPVSFCAEELEILQQASLVPDGPKPAVKLPPGWQMATDQRSGRAYYWHPLVNNGKPQWDKPKVADTQELIGVWNYEDGMSYTLRASGPAILFTQGHLTGTLLAGADAWYEGRVLDENRAFVGIMRLHHVDENDTVEATFVEEAGETHESKATRANVPKRRKSRLARDTPQARMSIYEIEVLKVGGLLGVHLDNTTLEIDHIPVGALAEYNRLTPERAVELGDRFLYVNDEGVSYIEQYTAAMNKEPVARAVLGRRVPPGCVASYSVTSSAAMSITLPGALAQVVFDNGDEWCHIYNAHSMSFNSESVFELRATGARKPRVLAKCVMDPLEVHFDVEGGEAPERARANSVKKTDSARKGPRAPRQSGRRSLASDDARTIRWRSERIVHFFGPGGREFATIKLSIAGFSVVNAGVSVANTIESTEYDFTHHVVADHNQHSDTSIALKSEQATGHNSNCTFDCPIFESMFTVKDDMEEAAITVKEGAWPIQGLIMGFATAFLFHPDRFRDEIGNMCLYRREGGMVARGSHQGMPHLTKEKGGIIARGFEPQGPSVQPFSPAGA